MTAGEIARLLGGDLHGDAGVAIERLAKIEEAGPGELTFLANPKYSKYVAGTSAAALLVGRTSLEAVRAVPRSLPLLLIAVDDPYRAFLRLIELYHPPVPAQPAGVHPTATVASDASLGSNVS